MDKKNLSESDICDKYIRPAMERAGWHGLEQIFREFPLRAGRVVVRGNKSHRDASTVLRADYALFHKPNIPLAVVEAKDNTHAVGAGMQQALRYANPVQIYEPKGDDPIAPPDALLDPLGPGNPLGFAPVDGQPQDPLNPLGPFGGTGGTPVIKYVLGNQVTVAVARERVQYLNAQGQLITESLRDYTRINLQKQYDSLDKFLQAWSAADRKAVLLEELEKHGVLVDALAEEVAATGQTGLDPFDLLLHVAWNMPALTRRERARRVQKRNVFTHYGPVARKVLEALLDKYADEGIAAMESDEVLRVQSLNALGSPVELIKSFGGRPQYLAALQALERELYTASP